MDQSGQKFGKPNPKAPAELSQFSFLVGRWKCNASVRVVSGEWLSLQAAWEGHYILDGYVIADEYRMALPSGELMVLGMNFRSYDVAKGTWNIKWLNALAGTWWDLGPQELGAVRFDGRSIVYSFKEPMAAHALTRVHTRISRRRALLGEVRNLTTSRPGPTSWY